MLIWSYLVAVQVGANPLLIIFCNFAIVKLKHINGLKLMAKQTSKQYHSYYLNSKRKREKHIHRNPCLARKNGERDSSISASTSIYYCIH